MSCDAVKTCTANGGATQFPPQPLVEVVTLRPATPLDAAMLAVVGSATFLEAYVWAMPGKDIVDFCLSRHTTAAYAAYLAAADTRITLAVTGEDAPVGYAMVCAPEFDAIDLQPGDAELKRIYRLYRYRSGRTGQRLMDAALADARSMGRTRLLVGTNAGNLRAIEFYRRNGFTDVGTRTFVVGEQVCCDLVLGRSL